MSTLQIRLCDDTGMVSHERTPPNAFDPELTYLKQLNNLRARTANAPPYTGDGFSCTGGAHLAGMAIQCTSPAHAVVTSTILSPHDSIAFVEMLQVETAGPALKAAMARRIPFTSAPSAAADPPPLTISYTNHRGIASARTVQPFSVWHGSTQWHPEPGWFLRAHDYGKGEARDFRMSDIGAATGLPMPGAAPPTNEAEARDERDQAGHALVRVLCDALIHFGKEAGYDLSDALGDEISPEMPEFVMPSSDPKDYVRGLARAVVDHLVEHVAARTRVEVEGAMAPGPSEREREIEARLTVFEAEDIVEIVRTGALELAGSARWEAALFNVRSSAPADIRYLLDLVSTLRAGDGA